METIRAYHQGEEPDNMPDDIPSDAPENLRAMAWRKRMGFSRRELSELVGYSENGIAAIERGEWSPGKPVAAETMLTYRTACAAVAAGLSFDWTRIEIEMRPVRRRRSGEGA